MKKYITNIVAASIFSCLLLNTTCSDTAYMHAGTYLSNEQVTIEKVIDIRPVDICLGSDLCFKEAPRYINLSVASYDKSDTQKEIPDMETEDAIIDISIEEIEFVARLTDAEAGGEPEYGQRLVIDTIFNRVERDEFPNTIYEVINQPNQYCPVSSSHIWNRELRQDLVELVKEEYINRTNNEVLFYRTDYYHPFGTPMFQVGAHYFSTL